MLLSFPMAFRGVDRVTHQRAKGMNGLGDRDIYIILTALNPDVYAKLNVIGQWLAEPNTIGMHYMDLINQAAGRNTGFRLSMRRATRTVVVTTN
jgi:hypothetical protein